MKTKLIALSLITTLMLPITAFAAEIPPETAPDGSDETSIAVTESLIATILDDVLLGEGFMTASAKADGIIREAVLSGNTGGYGYGILSAISRNAILYYRDMYLRPEYYKSAEENVRILIADLIVSVQNGGDYSAALDTAYTRIYQTADKTYNPATDRAGDFCYWDVPSIDAALLTMA